MLAWARQRSRGKLPLAVALVWLCIANAVWSLDLGSRAAGDLFNDPDTLMRLVLVRDLHAHGMQDGLFMRDDAPFGVALHWSHIISWMILGATKLLWFLPFERALAEVGLFFGPCMAAVCLVTAYWGARPLMPAWLAGAYGFTVVFGAAIVVYSKIGTANHHILMLFVALFLLAAAIRLDLRPDRRWLALLAGIVGGLGIWASFEIVPFAEVFLGYLALLWVMRGSIAAPGMVYAATGLCGTALLGLLIDPPYGGYASIELDRLSLPYALAFALQLAALAACFWLRPADARWRLGWLAALTALAALVDILVFPQCLGGPYAQINPFVREEEMPVLGELAPISRSWLAFKFAGNGVLGILAVWSVPMRMWRRAVYTGGLVVLCVMTFDHLRMSPYFWAAGSLAAFCYLKTTYAATGEAAQAWRYGRPLAAFGLVAGCLCIGDFSHGFSGEFAGYKPANCALSAVLPQLRDPAFLKADNPSPIFTTPFDRMSMFLYDTDYRALAGGYHSDPRGINDMYLMMRDLGTSTAHAMVRDHRIDYMLLCPTGDQPRFGVTDTALYLNKSKPDKEFTQPTFFTRLLNGDHPAWLVPRPWPPGIRTDLRLFQVVHDPETP